MAHPGPLGWIEPALRTREQHDAHAAALTRMVRFALAPQDVPVGTKVILTKFFDDPDVIADMGGRKFTGFRQLTGSCVGVSAGNAVACLSAVQRVIGETPQRAIIPWWGYDYGKTRQDEGDRGQGEGAVDSVMGTRLHRGVLDSANPGLPTFDVSDGYAVPSSTELQWSDGARIDPKWDAIAAATPVQSVAPISTTDEMITGIINGYICLNGCNYYIGRGSIKGTGANAYAVGKYDGRGGHSTCYAGYWKHPTDGDLLLYWNQWNGSTYPTDPAGAGRCMVWTPRANVDQLFRNGGDNGESMLLSHATTFPVQPKILDWYAAP